MAANLAAAPTATTSALVGAWGRVLRGVFGVLVLVLAREAFSAAGLRGMYVLTDAFAKGMSTALVLGAVVFGALAPVSLRAIGFSVISACAYPLLLGRWSVAVPLYAVVLCALARARVRLRFQIALALLAWSVLPVCRWVLPRGSFVASFGIFPAWAGLAYSSVYLLVERSRLARKPTLAEEIFYLLALPRVLHPFFQPISPAYLRRQERPDLPFRVVLGGVGLGLSAMALRALRAWLFHLRPSLPAPLAIVTGVASTYCIFAQTIFTSVSLFRLMGFDIASGFRRPFLACSFAGFFGRWNGYVREAVMSLFYMPLYMRLRRRLSPKVAAAAAAYVAILLGSFLLNQLLVPVSTSSSVLGALRAKTAPLLLLEMVVYWSAIVLPGTLFATKSPAGGARWFQTLRFLAVYLALQSAKWVLYHGGVTKR